MVCLGISNTRRDESYGKYPRGEEVLKHFERVAVASKVVDPRVMQEMAKQAAERLIRAGGSSELLL